MAREKQNGHWRRYWPRLLFVLPFVAVLWVPFYNRIEPELFGIPFFYWYQLLWILLGAAIVLAVYVIDIRINGATKSSDENDETGGPGGTL